LLLAIRVPKQNTFAFLAASVLAEAQYFGIKELINLLEKKQDKNESDISSSDDAHYFMETIVKQQRQMVDYNKHLQEILK